MDIDSIILKYCKELLSFDSFSGDWEEQFSARFPMLSEIDSNKRRSGDDYATGYVNGHIAGAGLALSEGYRKARDFIDAREEKIKEEIQKKITPDFLERFAEEIKNAE